MNLLQLRQLRQLPRDTRDTLFLLLVIAWILLPLAGQLPLWCSALSALVLLWRGWIAVQAKSLPSRWWLLLLLLLGAAGTWYSHHTLLGRDAGVTYIALLLALKTLEMRARRDAFVVFFLGFFTLLANFFFSQSLLTALSMVVGLLGLLTALVNHHMPVGRPPLLLAARTAAGMALLGAPIMVVLFVLFPRIAPLWGLPGDAMGGRSGLSATMQVGTIASLALDSSVAMRVRFEGAVPAQRDLYFRGPVLSTFNGRDWTPLRSAFPERLQLGHKLQVSGEPIAYEVTLEGNNQPWLPLLDATPERPTLRGYGVRMANTLDWTAVRPISETVRFKAQSYPRFSHGPLQPELGLQDMVDLPAGYNPRTLQLALELRREPRYANADAPALVAMLMDKLRTGGYRYTLDPGVYGRNTADEFWFDRKEGFCEHIASSFVLLLRALDVPARVVTGYQGGEMNAVDGYWTVRQSDAHAWAEVWMAGQGWVRVDPTSAVAPARTGSLQRLLPAPGVVAQALGAISPGFQINLRAFWEASNNRWNQWVLNYSQARQLDLLRNIGFTSPSWEDLGLVLISLIVALSLMGAAWAQWTRTRLDPWLRLLHAASSKLQKAGLEVAHSTPPRQLAQALQQRANSAAWARPTPAKAEADPGPARAMADTPADAAAQAALAPATAVRAELAPLLDWLLRLEAWRYAPSAGAPRQRRAALGTLRREFAQLRWPQHLPPNRLKPKP